ncbi:major capsid protein P2 [Janthinobacterium sp. LB2P10]|uniref:major capsid protein P2 n=1 Tax=Janthinobacterium sp. LB2P10 TaxID=3424194 RepID=UPI003F21533B
MGLRLKCLPFNNVVANGVATLDLSSLLGTTIERITLQLGGTALTKAMLTSIQMKANGKIIYDTSGARRDTCMQYRGITPNAGFLVIDFSEIRSKTELGQSLGSLDTTMGVTSLKLEIAIAGATAPTLQAWAEVDRPQVDVSQASTRPLIARVHSSNQTIGGSGQFSISVPHFAVSEGGSIYKRIAIFSANMTGLLIKKNGVVVEENIKSLNDYQQMEYKKVPQAGLYMMDFITDDNQSQALNTRDAQTMEILGTFSAGETIVIEVEVLEPLGVF